MSIKEDVEKVQNKIEHIEAQNFASELLHDSKIANKRIFLALIIILFMWFTTIGYLIYVLNDIGTETTNTQEITDIDTIENSSIINGGNNGEN